MAVAVKPFEFPAEMHVRRHGPGGYSDYDSYREWLRDEFCFRCVFCLKRELWDVRLGAFDLDHFVPQVVAPELKLDYDNLIYICKRCNSVKSDLDVPDPCKVSFSQCLKLSDSGVFEPLNEDGELLIEVLNLNEEDRVRYRQLIVTTLNSLQPEKINEILPLWLGYPEDLPDLKAKRCRSNSRPNGLDESWLQKNLRGELPTLY